MRHDQGLTVFGGRDRVPLVAVVVVRSSPQGQRASHDPERPAVPLRLPIVDQPLAVGVFGVPGGRVDDPDGAVFIVDHISHTTTAGDLVLPLF
jgi:hypothetical protein